MNCIIATIILGLMTTVGTSRLSHAPQSLISSRSLQSTLSNKGRKRPAPSQNPATHLKQLDRRNQPLTPPPFQSQFSKKLYKCPFYLLSYFPKPLY